MALSERRMRNYKVEGEYNHAISEASRLEAAIKEAKGEK